MPSVIAALDGIDFRALTERLASAKVTFSSGAALDVSGFDPRDLLGDLGAILQAPGALDISADDAVKSVVAEFSRLGGIVQLPKIPVLGDFTEGLQRLLQQFADTATQLGLGTNEIDLDALLPEISSLEGFCSEVIGEALAAIDPQVPAEITGALDAMKALASGNPLNGEGMAKLIATLLLDMNLGDLQNAAGVLNDHVGRIRTAGGDFAPIEAEIKRLTAAMRATVAAIEVPDVDVAAAVQSLARIRGEIGLLIHTTLPGALATLTVDLERIDPVGVTTALRARIETIGSLVPALPFNLEQELVAPFRSVAAVIDSLTPEQLGARFEELRQSVRAGQTAEGIGLLSNGIDDIFDVVIRAIRDLPVGRVRASLFDELHAIEARIRAFEGFEVPLSITDKLRALESKVDGIDLTALQGRVADLTGKISTVVAAFPVEGVKQEIQGVSQATADAIGEFSSAIGPITQKIEEFAKQLDAIDFGAASDEVTELLAGIREKIESVVESADLPDAAKVAIGVVAAALGKIEVRAEISGPFNAQLDKLDLSVVTKPLDTVTARVREVLQKVTPRTVIDELEGPFEQFSQAVQRVRPDALVARLSGEFQGLLGRLEAARPRNLVAPLEAEFRKLTDTVRQALDPAPLIAPLKALYQKLLELLELLDLEKVLGKILGKTANLPQAIGAQLGNAVQARAGGGGQLNTDPITGQFRFGDVLRPFAALIVQIREKVRSLTQGVLRDLLSALQVPLRPLVALAESGGMFVVQVADAVQERYRALDLFAEEGAAVELRLALNELDAAVASASFSGQAGVEAGGHMTAIRADFGVHASLDLQGQAATRSAKLGEGLDAPDLAGALSSAAERIRDLVPASLLSADPAGDIAAAIASLFDRFDLLPLVNELDALGARIVAKLEGMVKVIATGLVKLLNEFFEMLLPMTPTGMLERIKQGMQRVRAEFAVLDPTQLEQELRNIVDALVDTLDMFSPAHLAAQLDGLFDSVLAKLQQLDPARLLGDLSALNAVIDSVQALRPSLVLAPLIDSTKGLQSALDAVLSIDLSASLRTAIEKLRTEFEEVVAAIEAEFKALLSFLEGQAGGGGSVGAGI
jgi:hypothetical protein